MHIYILLVETVLLMKEFLIQPQEERGQLDKEMLVPAAEPWREVV